MILVVGFTCTSSDHLFQIYYKVRQVLLLRGINRQQTIFLSDLRFWFNGSISKCLAAAPVCLLGATPHFVLFSFRLVPSRYLCVFGEREDREEKCDVTFPW